MKNCRSVLPDTTLEDHELESPRRRIDLEAEVELDLRFGKLQEAVHNT